MKCCVCGTSDFEAALFSFPKAEPYRTEWKNFAQLEKIGLARMCHKHFSEDDIKTNKHRKRLKTNVVPTLNRNDQKSWSSEYDTYTNCYCMQCRTTAKRIHFQFPENPQRRSDWLKRCGYPVHYSTNEKRMYLCARHFADDMILRKGSARGHTTLRSKYAVPTLFMEVPESNGKSTSDVEETVDYSLFPTRILPRISDDDVDTLQPDVVIEIPIESDDDTVAEANPSMLPVQSSADCLPSTSSAVCPVASEMPNSNSDAMDASNSNLCDSSTTAMEVQSIPVAPPSSSNCVKVNSVHDDISPKTISKILDLHSNSDCAECAAFKRHVQNSLDRVSCPRATATSEPSKAGIRRFRYPGDISAADCDTPERARQAIDFLKGEIEKYRRKVDIFKKRNARLQKLKEKYDDAMIAQLEKEAEEQEL